MTKMTMRGGSALVVALILAGCGHSAPGAVANRLHHVASAASHPGVVTAHAEAAFAGTASVTLKLKLDDKGYSLMSAAPKAGRTIVIELRQGAGPNAPLAARVEITSEQAANGEVTVRIQGIKGGAYNAMIQDRDALGMLLSAVSWAVAVEEGIDNPLAPPPAALVPDQGPALGADEAPAAPRADVAAPVGAPAAADPAAPGARPAPVDLGPAGPGGGKTTRVPAGADLQAAIDAAQPGDTLVLDAGATYEGAFTLPAKQGNDYVTITSSGADKLGANERVTPKQASLMARIVSTGKGEAALATKAGAHHYRLVGLEFAQKNPDDVVYDLVRLGSTGSEQNTLEVVPHHISVDRCYLHPAPDGNLKRGIALNSANTEVMNCYIEGFKAQGQDSQAIAGWNGPGPFKIVNNHLEGAGENVIFGGSDPSIPNLVPSDIEFRHNEVTKPMSWRGGKWSVKNLFELKNARRVVADGNTFENNWADAQVGFAIVFTPRDQDGHAPWSCLEDITFSNNIVRHTASAVNVLGTDNLAPSQPARNVRVVNNLFEDVSKTYGGSGIFFQLGDGGGDIVVDHNTAFHDGNTAGLYGKPTQGVKFTNNIVANNAYGMHGDGKGSAIDGIDAFWPGAVVAGNLIAGGKASGYPAGNFFPAGENEAGFMDAATGNYRLAPNSAYRGKGTDGKDVGVDFDALEAAQGDPNMVRVD